MVIPADCERTMTSKYNQFKPADIKWSERPARLQHRFLVLRKLGQGTYGKVQLALNKETNQEVAIKTIKKAKIESEEDMLRIRREIYIMTSIRHPHIIHINEGTLRNISHSTVHHIRTTPGPLFFAVFEALPLSERKLSRLNLKLLCWKERLAILCKGSWASPLHLVPQMSEGWRPWDDYWALTAHSIPDRYPVEHIHDYASITGLKHFMCHRLGQG
ncbi:protein kinase domain-containing protein [Trichonephila clavata]|uniref:non-specific serine/threonine protein kinase n=1 Tax=Trichonephila clavata TaxID=2740835 RepID=A0A8X6I883_TRICU|nr:protein kinase domain-containing protein [Trichonephila clavata]